MLSRLSPGPKTTRTPTARPSAAQKAAAIQNPTPASRAFPRPRSSQRGRVLIPARISRRDDDENIAAPVEKADRVARRSRHSPKKSHTPPESKPPLKLRLGIPRRRGLLRGRCPPRFAIL